MFTQEQYSALIEAIALGATKVQYGDKVVEYRSLDDMRRLANEMAKQLGLVLPFGSGSNRRTGEYHPGWR